jgi:hypothetical protein
MSDFMDLVLEIRIIIIICLLLKLKNQKITIMFKINNKFL